ncbi:MAG: NlpC/P60 family protein [bacterium]
MKAPARTFLFVCILAGAAWHGAMAQLTPTQHQKLVNVARWLGKLGIHYSQEWRPPDEQSEWVMDCSNTARYIYRKALGMELPRTASDQYYELSLQRRITLAPRTADDGVDTPALLKMLRGGDLLFWEWTYNIKRRPPITHVMVYLGQTANGAPKMVGSACGARGERTRSGGVDVYVFDPNESSGGVRGFFGGYVKRGRFVGFGRPASSTQVEASPPPMVSTAALRPAANPN